MATSVQVLIPAPEPHYAGIALIPAWLENHVIRHMPDMEAIFTLEGTETIQTLIVGRHITVVSAFA